VAPGVADSRRDAADSVRRVEGALLFVVDAFGAVVVVAGGLGSGRIPRGVFAVAVSIATAAVSTRYLRARFGRRHVSPLQPGTLVALGVTGGGQ
jgi:hypothetical protein